MSTGAWFCGWRVRAPFLLLALTALLGVSAATAFADDPPVTTVPTPTTPTPVPAPTPVPPSPARKPAPKKSTPAQRTVHRAPAVTPRPSSAPAAVTPSAPVRAQTHVKPAKKVTKRPHRKKKVNKAVTSRPLPAPALKSSPPVGASAGLLPAAPGTKAGNSFNISGFFVIFGCAVAILCFGVAMVPATAVPWRPVAGFIAERQLDLTLTGLTLLVAVLAFYFLAGA